MKTSNAVLIVDDDPNMTRLLAHQFKSTEFAASPLNDPMQAMAMIQRCGFRIVLLDIEMPQKNGLELLEEIKAYDPTIAVVIITGYETFGNLIQAFQSGAEYITIKPITDFSKLVGLVQRCQDRLENWHEAIEAVRSAAPQVKS